MTDPFSWSINLGRWFGTHVRIHFLFLVFAIGEILSAALSKEQNQGVLVTCAWLALLLLALLLHEFGHASVAARLGIETDEVRLWPLGNLIGPTPPVLNRRSSEDFFAALAGPLMSLTATIVVYVGVYFAGAVPVLNPFGNEASGGAPTLAKGGVAANFSTIWWIGWFGYLNWVLFLANLIPALPFDAGRMLRVVTAGSSKDSMIAPWTARGFAIILGLAGIVRICTYPKSGSGLTLIALAVLIEIMVRMESRMLEEGGFFDDGVFGYDFSEGYTSLESSTPVVRPYRESALKRWRRRRSELRKQRRLAREAAEEQRMDEILAKLHSEGRSSLTDEENRFLVRVSAKYKNRSKNT
jgi:stage IV sporulation protein FB